MPHNGPARADDPPAGAVNHNPELRQSQWVTRPREKTSDQELLERHGRQEWDARVLQVAPVAS